MNALALWESLSSWGWPMAAAIGGIIVFVGLLIEKIAELKTEKHIPSFIESHKWLENLGWVFLMIGILVEIGVGFAVARKDEKDIDAAKYAWRSQRIYAFEATAILIVRPLEPVKDFDSLPKGVWFSLQPWSSQPPNSISDNRPVNLLLGRSFTMASGAYDVKFAQIAGDEVQRSMAIEMNGTNQWLRFDIHFGGHNFFENKFGNTLDFMNA
jgi:hypothetical protein